MGGQDRQVRTEFTKCSPPLHFSLEQNHPVVLGCTWWCHKGPGPKWEPQQLHSRVKNHQQDDHALGWPAAGRGRCQPMLPHPHHFNSRGTVGQQPPYGETAMFLVSHRVTASPGPAGDLQLAWGMPCPTPHLLPLENHLPERHGGSVSRFLITSPFS